MQHNMSREDYLQKKIHPYDPTKVETMEDALVALQECSFQGRNLGTALEVITKMVSTPNCLRVLTISGAMIPAGMEEVICQCIERGVVGAIVSTGANLTHSIVNATDPSHQAHYVGSANVDDDHMYKVGINRIYDTFLPNEGFRNADDELFALLRKDFELYKEYTLTPSELFKKIGLGLEGRCFLAVAARNNVPIFCGATSDSELGMNISYWDQWNDLHIILDELSDIENFASLLKSYDTWGTIILGGGVPRNWAQQIFPYLYVIQEKGERDYPGYEFSVRFHSAVAEDGGLSGCTISEGISWGKYQKDAKNVSIWGDSTVYFPLLITALFQRFDRQAQA